MSKSAAILKKENADLIKLTEMTSTRIDQSLRDNVDFMLEHGKYHLLNELYFGLHNGQRTTTITKWLLKYVPQLAFPPKPKHIGPVRRRSDVNAEIGLKLKEGWKKMPVPIWSEVPPFYVWQEEEPDQVSKIFGLDELMQANEKSLKRSLKQGQLPDVKNKKGVVVPFGTKPTQLEDYRRRMNAMVDKYLAQYDQAEPQVQSNQAEPQVQSNQSVAPAAQAMADDPAVTPVPAFTPEQFATQPQPKARKPRKAKAKAKAEPQVQSDQPEPQVQSDPVQSAATAFAVTTEAGFTDPNVLLNNIGNVAVAPATA